MSISKNRSLPAKHDLCVSYPARTEKLKVENFITCATKRRLSILRVEVARKGWKHRGKEDLFIYKQQKSELSVTRIGFFF